MTPDNSEVEAAIKHAERALDGKTPLIHAHLRVLIAAAREADLDLALIEALRGDIRGFKKENATLRAKLKEMEDKRGEG